AVHITPRARMEATDEPVTVTDRREASARTAAGPVVAKAAREGWRARGHEPRRARENAWRAPARAQAPPPRVAVDRAGRARGTSRPGRRRRPDGHEAASRRGRASACDRGHQRRRG